MNGRGHARDLVNATSTKDVKGLKTQTQSCNVIIKQNYDFQLACFLFLFSFRREIGQVFHRQSETDTPPHNLLLYPTNQITSIQG